MLEGQAGAQSRVLLQAGDGDGDSQRATRTSCPLLADLQWQEPVEKVGGETGGGGGEVKELVMIQLSSTEPPGQPLRLA